jgi:hypothetical protein
MAMGLLGPSKADSAMVQLAFWGVKSGTMYDTTIVNGAVARWQAHRTDVERVELHYLDHGKNDGHNSPVAGTSRTFAFSSSV